MAKKVALVTGAGSGIGASTSTRLSTNNYRLALMDVREDRLQETSKICQDKGLTKNEILLLTCDVRDREAVIASIEKAVQYFGRIDLLLNCAGVLKVGTGITGPMEDYDLQMDINLKGTITMCRETAPHLIKTKGNIINIGSYVTNQALTKATFYCVSKCALWIYTRCIANELGPQGVRVNAINPGTTKTNAWRNTGQTEQSYAEYLAAWLDLQPIKVTGMPEDIANAVLFLASDEARFITGAGLYVDGGTVNLALAPCYDCHM